MAELQSFAALEADLLYGPRDGTSPDGSESRGVEVTDREGVKGLIRRGREVKRG